MEEEYNHHESAEQDAYEPPFERPIGLTQDLEKQRVGFRRPVILTIVFILGAVSLYAYTAKMSSLGAKKQAKEEEPRPATRLSLDELDALPRDYSEIKYRDIEPEVRAAPAQEVYQTVQAPISNEREKLMAKLRRSSFAVKVASKSSRSSSLGRGAGSGIPGSSVAGLNPRDEDNRQDEKLAFLERVSSRATHINDNLHNAQSLYQLQAGTLVPAILVTSINTSLPGKIKIQVVEDVRDSINGEHILIPKLSEGIGEVDSRVAFGQERILGVIERFILPNGQSISIGRMPLVDPNGEAGLSADVDNHYDKLFTGVLLGSAIGAGAQVAEGNTSVLNPTYGQLATQGAAKNINRTTDRITNRYLNIQPTLTKSAGEKLSVFLTMDVTLQPYEGR